VRTEDQGRIKDNLWEWKCIPSFYVRGKLRGNKRGRGLGGEKAQGKTYASFMPRYCFVKSHVNSIKI